MATAQTQSTLVQAERRTMEAYGLDYHDRYLDLDAPQMRARVIDVGEGEPVLMVHGVLAVAAQWAPLMAELTGRRILAVDLPGYGLSDPFVFERGRLREVAVSFLDSVIDELGFESMPVIATSMGGLWSFWLALDRPSRVEALAQVACPALILDTSAPLPIRLMGVRGLNRALVRMLPTPDGPAELRQMGDGAAVDAARPELLELLEASETTEGYWPASFSMLEGALRLGRPRFQLTENELASVHQPTVFVWGDTDPFGAQEVGERAAAVMPDAELVRVSGGHLPWVGHPRAVAEPIQRLLDQVSGANAKA